MNIISDKEKYKILNIIFEVDSILEKSFFDLGDMSEEDSDNKPENDTKDDNTNPDNKTENDNDDNDSFSLQHKLQLKLLYSSMVNMISLSKYLYNINKEKFGSIYENYMRLFNYFKDYINNFEDLEPRKKVKLLKLFRESFKLINKKTFDTLNKL